jgi:hypothetical protein
MQNGNAPTPLRRSSRVPAAMSVLVTSLEGAHFSEVCQTLIVNAHGCAMLSRVKLDPGIPLHFHTKDGRETKGQVVFCQPVGPDNRNWKLGATLDQPQNFWGLKDYPQDWAIPAVTPKPRTLLQPRPASTTLAPRKLPIEANQPSEAVLNRIAHQLELQVAKMIGESVRPLQSEIVELKEKLAKREAGPSRFEVSLGSIPPELEQQLQLRLRQDLGPRLLDDSRRQYASLLTAAKTEIEQRTTQAQEEFMRRVTQELQIVEQRAEDLSRHVTENALEHLRRGLEDFHQKLLDGGHSLKRLSEELLDYLQHNLNDECNARREELEQFRERVAAESTRLHEHIEYIDVRIRKLDESAHSLESGLDQRLSMMSSNTVKDARSQLENVTNDALDEFATRGSKVLTDQLDEAHAKMSMVQREVAISTGESLKIEASNALRSFEQSMEELAQLSVDRYRSRLAEGLSALVKNLDQQFPQARCGESSSANE